MKKFEIKTIEVWEEEHEVEANTEEEARALVLEEDFMIRGTQQYCSISSCKEVAA